MSIARLAWALPLVALGALGAVAAADPPAPPCPGRVPERGPGAYRVIAPQPTWGAIAGTVRLARALPLPHITLPETPREVDLTWTQRRSDLLAYDAQRLTLAGVLVFLARIDAGKDWPEPLRAAHPAVTLTLRDGFLLPNVQWTRTGADLRLVSEQSASMANPRGSLQSWDRPARADLQFNVFLGPGARLEPWDESRLSRAGLLAVGSPDCCFAWTRAHVAVFEHPYVAGPTAQDGAFRLEHVPPGRYELVAWHGPTWLRLPDAARPTHWEFGSPLTTRTAVTVTCSGTLGVDLVLHPGS